jgi:hypothetical protein
MQNFHGQNNVNAFYVLQNWWIANSLLLTDISVISRAGINVKNSVL